MEIILHDSEIRVMRVLWEKEEAPAKDIAAELGRKYGYSKTTTYTLIKRCIEKGAISRTDPGFLCRPLISLSQVQQQQTGELINKLYDGASDKFIASFLGSGKLSAEEIEKLKNLINNWSDTD